MAPKDFQEAVAIVRSRRLAQSALIGQMVQVQQRYNGTYTLPVSKSDDQSDRPIVSPALINEAVDTPALRAASVEPMWFCPALDPTKDKGTKSVDRANTRSKALVSTYRQSKAKLILRKAYRQIAGYGMAAMVIVPDDKTNMPRLSLRDPLSAYPEPKDSHDVSLVENVGFVYLKSGNWLRSRYPEAREENGGPVMDSVAVGGNDLWEVLEWMDETTTRVGVMGQHRQQTRWGTTEMPMELGGKEVHSWPNRLGFCPAVVPQTITLDRLVSRLYFMCAKTDLMAYLIDLDIQATEKSIFPDRWISSQPNETAEIVGADGRWQDGRTGHVNILKGMAGIGELRGTPDPNNKNTINQLEEYARQDTALTDSMTGQVGGQAMRTGRGLSTLQGISVDPRIQEMQQIMEISLECMNEAIFATFEKEWGNRSYTLFTGLEGDDSHVSFTPNVELAESHESMVSYAIPGADAGQQTVEIAQLVQAGLMSRKTGRRQHPHIKNPFQQEREILEEELDDAQLVALKQTAIQGQLPPQIAAAIRIHVREGMELDEAIIAAHNEEQKRQATVAPPAGPDQIAAPEAMPGLGAPGTGQPPNPAGPGAPPGLDEAQGMKRLIGALTSAPGNPNLQNVA